MSDSKCLKIRFYHCQNDIYIIYRLHTVTRTNQKVEIFKWSLSIWMVLKLGRSEIIVHHLCCSCPDYFARSSAAHDDVIKWKHFPRNWPFVRGIHRSPVNSPHKASDAELWCLLWSVPEQTVEQKQLSRRGFEMSSRSFWHTVMIHVFVCFIKTIQHNKDWRYYTSGISLGMCQPMRDAVTL